MAAMLYASVPTTTWPDAALEVSDWLVAVTVTVLGLGAVAGAVYDPVADTVPVLVLPPANPFTDQVTAEE